MAKIHINNPKQVINGGAKKYYFKVKGLGGPKGDKGDKGDTGSQGPQGPQGNAATVSVGSTTTLPVGYDATVTNSGSIYNAVLNFGIPQGPRGPQGATGAKGDKGDKGEQGNPGPQGEKGTNATVTVGTTTTTDPGTQAYAWNSSSNPNNAVINFNIPRGATGAQGAQGPQGVQGPTGPAGADGESFTPVVVSSLPATGTEGKLYLTPKNYTTGTATGNPIAISLGEVAGQIDSFQLDGDTYQQTYTGKNLFNQNDAHQRGFIGENGGISDSSTNISVVYTEYCPVEAEHTYTISYNIIATGSSVRYIGFYDSSFSFISRTTQESSEASAFTFSTPANTRYVRVNFRNLNGMETETFLTDYINNIQIEEGSTATAYEPYVGGQPSPSPDYPQQIQTVTGLQTVEVSGKNLFDGIFELGNINPTTGANTSSTTTIRTKNYAAIKGGENYTISVVGGGTVALGFYQSNGTFIGVGTTKASPNTFTAPANAGRVRFIIASNTNTSTKAQCEKGSSATDWTPYSKQTYEINLGKNLFNKNNVVNGIPQAADGSIGQITRDGRTCEFIPVLPSTQYTHSGHPAGWAVVAFYRADKSFIQRVSDVTTITTPSDCAYASVSCSVDNLDTCQFELGATATAYAPYFTPIELCKLGTYQDYIYKDGDDWKVHKATNKAELDGTESWVKGNGGTSHWYHLANIFSKLKSINQPNPFSKFAYSTHYENREITNANTQLGFTILTANNLANIRIRTSGEDTTSNFKAWLATNKPAVYAPLPTEFQTDTVITDTTLIAQLEAIRTASLQASNTITNSTPAPNLAGDMEVGYYSYNPTNRYDKWIWLDINNSYEQLNNPESTAALSSTRSLSTATEQTTPTRSVETTTLKKDASEPVVDKTETEENSEQVEPEKEEEPEKR